MATILDIAGKPLPPRNRTKRRLRSQDLRDLVKILLVFLLIVIGYFMFAPNREAAEGTDIAAAQRSQG
jgi:uncharacterized membrane protein